jgi:hypothetical protein
MSDIFISYARSTAKEADKVAESLRSLGYNVWRDEDLPAHRSYADVIEERLLAARAVVVVWSSEAAKSEWVQSEADFARQNHKLVQLTVDGSACRCHSTASSARTFQGGMVIPRRLVGTRCSPVSVTSTIPRLAASRFDRQVRALGQPNHFWPC